MSAFNIEKMSDLIDEKISENNEELMAAFGKATPVAKEIVKDGKTYVLKADDDEEMDKEDEEDMEKEEEDDKEVKKALEAKIEKLATLLQEKHAHTPTRNPVAQDSNIEKSVGGFTADISKSIQTSPHLDKIEHRDSYYNVKWSNDDQEFQARIKKYHSLHGFDPSQLGMSLPTNEL